MTSRRPITTWCGTSTHPAEQLRRKHRDRRTLSAETVVNRMFEGARLHLHHDKRRGPVWRMLVMAAEVSDEVARLVIQRDDIVPVGDALFDDCLSQTYRYAEDNKEEPND
jgi:hypothetical protein